MYKVWLDDVREPWRYGYLGVEWVKTAEKAIELLKTGKVHWISLDHDLVWEHYPWNNIPESEWKTKPGMAVLDFMIENNIWPETVLVHTANPEKYPVMVEKVIKNHPRYKNNDI